MLGGLLLLGMTKECVLYRERALIDIKHCTHALPALWHASLCYACYAVLQGLLWVWLESGAEAVRESAVWPRALPSELRDGTGVLLGDW